MVRNRSELHERGDAALAALARADDSDAYAILWSRHASAGAAAARQFAAIADPDDIVAEAFLRIFRAMQQGGGPREDFRPYLYRTIRNIALDWRAKADSVSLEVLPELRDDGSDPETFTTERHVTVRAFRTLPDRWQAVLWYLEVEGMEPAEVAPILQLSPNGVSALAVRAREGLKRAWLQAHVNEHPVPEGCTWTTERMGAYARGGLTPRARARFDDHLDSCDRCTSLVDELRGVGGSLAGLLLPTLLGGGAAAGLLSQLLSARTTAPTTSASAPRLAPGRAALIAGAAALAVAAITSGALAATGVWPTLPPDIEGTQSLPTLGGQGTTAPTPKPSPSAPPTPTPPPTEAVPPFRSTLPPTVPTPPTTPPDLDAPAVPVVLAPLPGALTNKAMPTFTGEGEPGARVEVMRSDPATGNLLPVATATVDWAGRWSTSPTSAMGDGAHILWIAQVDVAGNRSAADVRTLTVDTVALPPQVDAVSAQPMLFLPDITGTAEPGATVTLADELAVPLGTTVAGTDGRWSLRLPDPDRDGAQVSAVQTDPAGNISPSSTATPPLVFDRPSVVSPASGAVIPSTGGATVVQLALGGYEGMRVEVFVDGVGTGNLHTLEASPIIRVTAPLSDGPHTVAVRYVDGGMVGSRSTMSFVIS